MASVSVSDRFSINNVSVSGDSMFFGITLSTRSSISSLVTEIGGANCIATGDGSDQGDITFSGGTVTYGAFTAHHHCIIPDADNTPTSIDNAYPYGTLLEITSIQYTKQKSN